MFETNLNCEIESGAISARLATADDLSKHKSPYFEILSASTIVGRASRIGRPLSKSGQSLTFPLVPISAESLSNAKARVASAGVWNRTRDAWLGESISSHENSEKP
jgi:hypothetical protein